MKKQAKKKRPVFQSVVNDDQLRKLQCIADYRGVNKSAVFRGWIESAYSRLPEDAKQ